MNKIILLVLMMLYACGSNDRTHDYRTDKHQTDLERLEEAILQLQGLQSQISAVILSDYATCATVPADGGNTNDNLVRKICQIAQASTVEAKVEMKGQLQAYVSVLEQELDSAQDRISVLETNNAGIAQMMTDLYGTGTSCANATAGSLCVRISTLETSVSTLQSQMTSAQSAISTLQSQVSTINSTLTGMMTDIIIGSENLSAGPYYETILRRQDRTRINAYIQDISSNVSLGSNPFNATNGSATVTVTSTAHGLSVGNIVEFYGLSSGRGFTSGQVNDSYTVDTVPTANTFTITMSSNATSNGGLGGSVGYYHRVNGRGLGQVWQSSDGEVYSTSSFSNKPYSFIFTGASSTFTAAPTGASLPGGWAGLTPGFGFVCYSKTNRSANASVIKTGGSSIVCK